jgi:5-formyltetrahydrofolate cyclo-ligase
LELQEKAILRRELLRSRMALAPDLYRKYSDRLCTHLQEFLTEQVTPGQTILAYQPHRQEPDLRNLWENVSYRWGLPRCLPDRQLAWHYWQPSDQLAVNAYGLAEPLATASLVDLDSISVLLIPVVGFDVRGYRLGYGGGYFDRLLASPGWEKVMRIGIAFDQALIPAIPTDPWDLALHRIFTESGMVVYLV